MTTISAIMLRTQSRTDAKPVIFSGFKPRLLGYAASQRDAAMLGVIHRISSRYMSTARCNFPNGHVSDEFFLLHE